MADLLGKAIGGLGGGALNSLTNGIYPMQCGSLRILIPTLSVREGVHCALSITLFLSRVKGEGGVQKI